MRWLNFSLTFSSSDRLTLLFTIRKEENVRLTQLAEKIRATLQETSRHLRLLTDAKLIKNSDRFFNLTSYCRLIMVLLPSYVFLSKNRDYFLSHDISFLPQEFIERIGELSVYEHAPNVSSILRHTGQVKSLANEYVWLMADQALITSPSIAEVVGNRDLSVRIMIPRSRHIIAS